MIVGLLLSGRISLAALSGRIDPVHFIPCHVHVEQRAPRSSVAEESSHRMGQRLWSIGHPCPARLGRSDPDLTLDTSVLGALAEFERALIHERQRERIEAAEKAGVYKGRKKTLFIAQVGELQRRAEAGDSKASLARNLASAGRPSTSI
ncbi:recombinase family protein [Deinococcus aerolatus]